MCLASKIAVEIPIVDPEPDLVVDVKAVSDSCGICEIQVDYENVNEDYVGVFRQSREMFFSVACFEVNSFSQQPTDDSVGIIAMGRIGKNKYDLQNHYFGTFELKQTDAFDQWANEFAANYELDLHESDFDIFDDEPFFTVDDDHISFCANAVGGVPCEWDKETTLQCWAYHGHENFDYTSFANYEMIGCANLYLHSCLCSQEIAGYEQLFDIGYSDAIFGEVEVEEEEEEECEGEDTADIGLPEPSGLGL